MTGRTASTSPALALAFVRDYAKDKAARKEAGGGAARAIPCINHPVFKDRPVNIDPREEYVRNLMESRGEYNVFHDFYRTLVQTLFDEGVTRNVFCVNVDALIATLLLKVLWDPYRAGRAVERASSRPPRSPCSCTPG